MIENQNLESFFESLLGPALTSEGFELETGTKQYLVQLCADFARRPPEGDDTTATLAWLYEEARLAAPLQQAEAYRRLGDVALVVPSLFAPYVDRPRALVGRRYYIDMGRGAYQAAAARARSGLGALLQELAVKFQRLVDVLTRVAEATTLPIRQDIDTLIRRLQQDPSDAPAHRQLVSQGLIPLLDRPGRA